jgi:hypothetical protein
MKDRWGFSNHVRLDVNCISRTLLPAYGVIQAKMEFVLRQENRVLVLSMK